MTNYRPAPRDFQIALEADWHAHMLWARAEDAWRNRLIDEVEALSGEPRSRWISDKVRELGDLYRLMIKEEQP